MTPHSQPINNILYRYTYLLCLSNIYKPRNRKLTLYYKTDVITDI